MLIFPRPSQNLTKKQRAYSLTELAIVLGIVSVIFGAIWSASSMVYRNMLLNQSISDLSLLTQTIRDFYKGQSKFDKSTGSNLTDFLVDAKLFPASMIEKNTNLPVTPWRTDIKVYVGSEKDTFRIVYEDGLPEDVCRLLAGRIAGKGRARGLVNVTAGGSSFTTSNELNNLTSLDITGSCQSLSLTFKLKS